MAEGEEKRFMASFSEKVHNFTSPPLFRLIRNRCLHHPLGIPFFLSRSTTFETFRFFAGSGTASKVTKDQNDTIQDTTTAAGTSGGAKDGNKGFSIPGTAGKDITADRAGDEEDPKGHGLFHKTGHATDTATGVATPINSKNVCGNGLGEGRMLTGQEGKRRGKWDRCQGCCLGL